MTQNKHESTEPIETSKTAAESSPEVGSEELSQESEALLAEQEELGRSMGVELRGLDTELAAAFEDLERMLSTKEISETEAQQALKDMITELRDQDALAELETLREESFDQKAKQIRRTILVNNINHSIKSYGSVVGGLTESGAEIIERTATPLVKTVGATVREAGRAGSEVLHNVGESLVEVVRSGGEATVDVAMRLLEKSGKATGRAVGGLVKGLVEGLMA